MRVLQVTTDLRFGGAERVIAELARGLREAGVECAIAGLSEGDERVGRAGLLLRDEAFAVHSAGMRRKWMLWRLAGLRSFVKQWRPDVLHCHLFHGHAAGLALRLAGLECPMVWTHHSVDRRPLRLRRLFYRLAGRVPDCHVFASQAVMEFQMRRAGRMRQGRVIYNGIGLERYLSVSPRAGPVFGALGRLVPEKGFDVLVRAFAGLSKDDESLRLKIGGDGPERQSLERLIRSEGVSAKVELAGFVEDVPAFLAGVNVFVTASRWEAFGLTLLEALAAGLPCIASRVGGLAEVGGDLVEWVPPGDVGALRAAMRRMQSRPDDAEQVARRRKAAARFSQTEMAQRYLSVYRSLLQ